MPLLETIGSSSVQGYKSGAKLSHVTSGLVLDWDFSNPASYPGTGNTITDLSGSGRTGTKTAATNFSPDVYGGGFVFTGPNYNNTWIDFPSSTYLVQGTNPFTIEGWHNAAGAGGGVLLNNYPGSDGGNTIWVYYNGFYLGDSTGYMTPSTLGLGLHHLVVTRSGNTIKVYLDNVLKQTATNTRSAISSQWRYASDYNLNGSGGEGFNGTAYISRVYNRALSDEEVAQNFNAYRTRFGK